jgi:hypothetical protein
MKETDVLRLLLARRENYGVSNLEHLSGRVYSLVMNGERYTAVVLSHSFEFYEKRYHIADRVPNLVVCYAHDTVLPVKCLHLRAGNLAQVYELPEQIYDVEQQRQRSKTGAQVLLGMYLCGLRSGQAIINDLPITTRKRYLEKAEMLGKRKRGKPVARIEKQASAERPS